MTKNDVKLTVAGLENLKANYTRACLRQLDLRKKREAGLEGPPAGNRPSNKTA